MNKNVVIRRSISSKSEKGWQPRFDSNAASGGWKSLSDGAAGFELVSLWTVPAPQLQVWSVLSDGASWPNWWPFVEAVEQIYAGEPDGRDSVWRYTWRTMLPYKLRFWLRMTRIQAPSLLEAEVMGDVCGHGCCRLTEAGDTTAVRFQWNVQIRQNWMRRLAPIARPVFVWNHRRVMENGEAALRQWLRRRSERTTGMAG